MEWEPCQYSGLAAGLTQAHRAIHQNDTWAGIDGKTTGALLRGFAEPSKMCTGFEISNLLVQLFNAEMLLQCILQEL